MPDLDCRVAKLEQAVDGLRDMIEEMKNENRRRSDHIHEVLDEIKSTIDKQRSFVGGVIFTVTAIFSVLSWVISPKIFGGNG